MKNFNDVAFVLHGQTPIRDNKNTFMPSVKLFTIIIATFNDVAFFFNFLMMSFCCVFNFKNKEGELTIGQKGLNNYY